MKVETRSKLMVIEPLDSSGKQLFVHVEVDCGGCPGYEIILHGPHVRTLHHILGEVIATYPTLCGEIAPQVEQTQFQGVVDPRKVQDN